MLHQVSFERNLETLFNSYLNCCLITYRSRKFCNEPYSTDSGVRATLAVIRAVASHDEISCNTFNENRKWAAVNTFLRLASCSIDVLLKADLLMTLSALGKSVENALSLWFNLESSQIITTIPSTNESNTVPRDIGSEIDKIESCNGAYPLTQAIFELLYTLSSKILPRNLGAGQRKPGMYPYFKFVLESIFLEFPKRYAIKISINYIWSQRIIFGICIHRSYKDESEKWIVVEKCLKMFDFFTYTYEIDSTHFSDMGENDCEFPPPGFYIMLDMNRKEKSVLKR